MPLLLEECNNADTGYWVNPDSCCFDISKFIDFTTAIIKNNKLGIQGHFSQKSELSWLKTLGSSSTERIRIIRIDNREYIQFTNKGSSPIVITHEIKQVKSKERSLTF